MSGLGVNTVKSAAGRSIKYASITPIHFLSVACVCVYDTTSEGKHSNSLHANLNGASPGGGSNYGFSSVSWTVMHTYETALWPSACHTQGVFRLRAPLQ